MELTCIEDPFGFICSTSDAMVNNNDDDDDNDNYHVGHEAHDKSLQGCKTRGITHVPPIQLHLVIKITQLARSKNKMMYMK